MGSHFMCARQARSRTSLSARLPHSFTHLTTARITKNLGHWCATEWKFSAAAIVPGTIVISGLGWVAVAGYGTKELDVWVPRGVKVFRRPSLMPNEMRNRGITRFHANHRARTPSIFRKKKAIVRERRDKALRDVLRAEQAQIEEQRAAIVDAPDDVPFVESGLQLPEEFTVLTCNEGESETESSSILPSQ